MFTVNNDVRYRVICVPCDTDVHWYYVDHFDDLDDAQSCADTNNRLHGDDGRCYVTRIGDADMLRSMFSDEPPVPVE